MDSAEKMRNENDAAKRNVATADDTQGPGKPDQPLAARAGAAGGDDAETVAPRSYLNEGEKVAGNFVACGSCGSREFFKFGPYVDSDDPGLRWIYTCSSCGEPLRIYQTSETWRQHRELFRALLRQERHEQRVRR